MTNRRWRFSVFLFVALLSVSLVVKSRTLPRRGGAAFLRYTTGAILVKVNGDRDKEGVYRIIDGQIQNSVNKMTRRFEGGSPAMRLPGIKNGDLVEITEKTARLTGRRMTVTELILLGVPLDIQAMTAADWSSLPGIGPSLASRINHYRQKNGGISSIEELCELPGVGEGRIEKIRQLFKAR